MRNLTIPRRLPVLFVFLVSVSALIGYAGFTTVPRVSVFILAVPVLWTLADSRYSAFAVVLAYKLAASRGLLPGAAVFLSESHTPLQAAALYLLLPFGASLPFLLFWSGNKNRKAVCLVLAFIAAYVLPPVSLIGVINPLMASGTMFRGWGFAGILTVTAAYALCAVSKKSAYAFLCVIALTAVLPNYCWYRVPAPEGVIAVDTSFSRLGSGSFNFTQDYERSNMVFSELRKRGIAQSGAGVIVLPETIAGRLNNSGLGLWRSEIHRLMPGKAVIFGAELPAGDGRKYNNAAVMFHGGDAGKTSTVYQRIPVPYSMYRGPFAQTGAKLNLWHSGILTLPDGRRAAVIICYEAFLTWPFLISMFHSPDMIICMANLWWCRQTSIPATMEAAVSLWALTFGVPAAFARNI